MVRDEIELATKHLCRLLPAHQLPMFPPGQQEGVCVGLFYLDYCQASWLGTAIAALAPIGGNVIRLELTFLLIEAP